MLDIQKIDHIGIRVHQEDRAVEFYQKLGFNLESRGLFNKGHPIIMSHSCGLAINILGPANQPDETNILQDNDKKFAGYTHIALRVGSLKDAEEFMMKNQLKITERLKFGTLNAFFIRDPDGNVIELDEYPGEAPDTRLGKKKSENFEGHP